MNEFLFFSIIRFRTSGLRHKAQKYILQHRIFKEEPSTFDTVEFEQIIQLLKFLTIGMIISLFIFISELVLKYFILNKSGKRNTWMREHRKAKVKVLKIPIKKRNNHTENMHNHLVPKIGKDKNFTTDQPIWQNENKSREKIFLPSSLDTRRWRD